MEEFSPLCEVQSDKASVEITSRFAGTVKKLYYEAGEMARVGKPFVDIDIQGTAQEDVEALTAPGPGQEDPIPAGDQIAEATSREVTMPEVQGNDAALEPSRTDGAVHKPKGKMAGLATPAVRHLSKELQVDITDIDGSGKDGRVLKEDIYKFVQARDAGQGVSHPSVAPGPTSSATGAGQSESRVQLSPTQHMMFKTMTRSLTIPHFLFADELDFSQLVMLRQRLNRVLAQSLPVDGQPIKLSYLPFIIKAVSMALYQFPILNARVEVDAQTSKPSLVFRSQHNIGVAMDTPQGLIVPVIKNVGNMNIVSIAAELSRLQALASQGKLSPSDLAGGTVTVSNIGNIGGTYLSPVIVEREVAILGVGRMRTVPAFDEEDKLVKKQVCNFSWSADHRVVDGATLARAAGVVRKMVEEPDVMVMHLR